MTRFGKLKKASLALAIAAGLGTSGAVHAGVLAQSILQVTNFQIQDGVSGARLDISNFTNPILQDSGTNSANLTSFASMINPLSQFGGGLFDVPQACVGIGCDFSPAGTNNFTKTLAVISAPTQRARSDSLLDGSPVSGIIGAPNPANARTVAEVDLSGSGVGGGNSSLVENTLFNFTLAQSRTLKIAFDADIYLRTILTSNTKIGSSASATSNLSFNLFDRNTNLKVFSWTPDGTPGGIFGGLENLDPINLNDSLTALIPGDNFVRNAGVNSFLATSFAIPTGSYQFVVSHVVSANGTQVVPEPETLLLAGVGFIGVALTRRRAKRAV